MVVKVNIRHISSIAATFCAVVPRFLNAVSSQFTTTYNLTSDSCPADNSYNFVGLYYFSAALA